MGYMNASILNELKNKEVFGVKMFVTITNMIIQMFKYKLFNIWKLIIQAFLRVHKEGDTFVYCITHVKDIAKLEKDQRSCYFHVSCFVNYFSHS